MGIDQLLFPDSLSDLDPYPGRMSALTAVNFLLLGPAFLVRGLWGRHFYAPFIVVAIVSLISFLGFVYGSVRTGRELNSYPSASPRKRFNLVSGPCRSSKDGETMVGGSPNGRPARSP